MKLPLINVTIRALGGDEERRIEGWATKPQEDRLGDVVDPEGVVYRLPLPFLLDHDHEKCVGEVDRVTVSSAGIRFSAKIAKVDEPGSVKDACDAAWHMIRAGLRKAVSIGFRALEREPADRG